LLPPVCRLGLATRGGSRITVADVHWAIDRGENYLNWCGHADGLSQAIASLGKRRADVVIAVQFEARRGEEAHRELASMLAQLRTDYIDIATLYYVEAETEWQEIVSPGGAWEALEAEKRAGRLRMIGLTSHQRRLAAGWARSGKLDMLMIRYNAAHRGAEREVFPVAMEAGIPVVTFTGLRWRALLEPSPHAHPSAVDCYRFCLSNPATSVALTAPGNGDELRENLKLLDDWHALSPEELQAMQLHGDHVRLHAGPFW
jgi:aryl-alcohol dehydrogenase-like predicted oxidoreductase